MIYRVHVLETIEQEYEVEAVDPNKARDLVHAFLCGELLDTTEIVECKPQPCGYNDPENWEVD